MTVGEVSVNVALGSEVALECDVLDSKPPPQIVWHDGEGNEINEITVNTKRRFLDDRQSEIVSLYLYYTILYEKYCVHMCTCPLTHYYNNK